MGRRRRVTHPQRVSAAIVHRQAIALRAQGYTIAEIAERVGRSPTTIHKAIQRYLERLPVENIEAIRRIELERLDIATRVVMEAIQNGDISAVDRLVKLVDLRMRITGAYQVQTVDVSQPIQLVWPDGSVVGQPEPARPELTD